jgi:hypothetical protein
MEKLFLVYVILFSSFIWCSSNSSLIEFNDAAKRVLFNIRNANNQLGNQQCQRSMTLDQIILLLLQRPCVIIAKNIKGTNRTDIRTLQATINEHRSMLNYLINNCVNSNYVSDAIKYHHSKTGPVLTSWRDLVDVFMITLFMLTVIYLLICRPQHHQQHSETHMGIQHRMNDGNKTTTDGHHSTRHGF